jgi:hypothetical protein
MAIQQQEFHHMIVKKEDSEKRIVMGEVYAPMIPDAQGDFMTAEAIEKCAHNFMLKLRNTQVDVQHDNQPVEGVSVVESFIAREGDPDFIPGSWVVAVHVPDDALWLKIKNREINGFSMEARVYRQEAEILLEVPPVLSGVTSEDAGHSHKFYVAYSQEGDFLGGKTEVEDGHYHEIHLGTCTEEANGHKHTFSFVERIHGEITN